MKTRKLIHLFILLGVLAVSCSESDVLEKKDPPKKNDGNIVTHEKIAIPFNYKVSDKRPHITCDSYTDKQKDSLNRSFAQFVGKARTTRGRVVSAGIFLVNMDYCIPYSWSMKDSRDNVYPGYEYCTLWNKKGLFLESVEYNGHLQPAWGCLVKRVPGVREYVKNIGDYFANGLNCSSFVGWCLVNGGVATSEQLYKTYSDGYRNYPKSVAVPLRQGYKDILPGDLLWFSGHISIVIGVEGDYVIYASAQGGGDAALTGHGIRRINFNRKTTNYDTFTYTHLIKMAGVY